MKEGVGVRGMGSEFVRADREKGREMGPQMEGGPTLVREEVGKGNIAGVLHVRFPLHDHTYQHM